MKNVLKKIRTFSFHNDLWGCGSKIVVCVSGGPDSVAMLHIFSALASKYDLSLHVAHMNYGLRAADSEKDESHVAATCRSLAIPYTVRKVKVAKGGNLEERLRDMRYAFFEELRLELNFDLIAVAHSRDDQAETVLIRLLRGAGLQGLAGMQPRVGKVVRPLLCLGRDEIIDYLKAHKLKYRIDKSNRDLSIMRNRIRHRLLPYIEKNFPDASRGNLATSATVIGRDYDFILSKAEEERIWQRSADDSVVIDKEALLGAHPALAAHCLLQALALVKGERRGLESAHVSEILKIARSTKGKTQKIAFKGLNVVRKGGKIHISATK